MNQFVSYLVRWNYSENQWEMMLCYMSKLIAKFRLQSILPPTPPPHRQSKCYVICEYSIPFPLSMNFLSTTGSSENLPLYFNRCKET